LLLLFLDLLFELLQPFRRDFQGRFLRLIQMHVHELRMDDLHIVVG